MCCRSKWSVHFTCLSCSSQCSRICTLTFFACRWGLECAGLQVLKITKQREAAACKLWMRSRSADTARAVTREGILFWILPRGVMPLLCLCRFPCLPCAFLFFLFRLQLQVIKTACLSWHLLLYGWSKVQTAFKNNKNRLCIGLFHESGLCQLSLGVHCAL